MPRPILTILTELEANLAELRQALEPLSKLSAAFAGHDGPFPMKPASKAERKPRGRKAAVRSAAPKVDLTASPTLQAVAEPTAPAAPPKAPRKGKPNPRMALQGKYMVALRKLSKTDQAEVKRIRAEQGIEAALRAAATAAA